ncbi:hypothetical protein MY5147_001753 [Beauveria neobassiana]
MPPLTYLQKTNGFIAAQQPSTPGIIASSVGYLRELERKAKALDSQYMPTTSQTCGQRPADENTIKKTPGIRQQQALA